MIASPTSRSIQNSETSYMSSSQLSTGVFPFSATTGWVGVLSILGLATAANQKNEKCYSCSSAHLNVRWPKTSDNRLMYEVVSCPNSVCVKVVIEEPPPSRAVCSQEPVVIRDCWSRIVQPQDQFDLKPNSSKPVRLASGDNFDHTMGHIYTCEGYLCNETRCLHPANCYLLMLIIVLFINVVNV